MQATNLKLESQQFMYMYMYMYMYTASVGASVGLPQQLDWEQVLV